MKFQIYSDLHLEFLSTFPRIQPLCPILILAGDIGHIDNQNYRNFLQYCNQHWQHVILILGNHEYYTNEGETMSSLERRYLDYIQELDNIHLLLDSSIEIENYRFVGGTLWSQPCDSLRGLVDGRFIFTQVGEKIDCHKMCQLHCQSRDKIIDQIDSQTIVVTHFPPIQSGIEDPRYSNEPNYIKSYFYNKIDLGEKKPLIWIYGHTHYSCDVIHQGVRYVSNQLGYREEIKTSRFNPESTYEV